jgi:RNA polymerase sigma-70 factor, ECF subfamily
MNGYPLKIPAIKSVWAGMNIRKMNPVEAVIEKSDNDLIKEASNGRSSAFKELVERYQKQAYLFARGMVHNTDDAYDLSQEAFVRVYKHLKRFDYAYPFRVWLFHILANLCKNHLRQRKTRDNVVTDTGEEMPEGVSETGNPDIIFNQSETQARVWQGIGRLPEKFREIIILSHFQDMSYDQMAQVLEIPRGSVMSRLYYARLKLREILEEMGVEL